MFQQWDDPAFPEWQEHLLSKVESIVAARVRAAQAQAWDEGAQNEYQLQNGPLGLVSHENPYRLDAGDEFQDSED